MIATLLATVDPGDEVIVFAPCDEDDGPDAVLSGATPRYVTLHAPDWTIDEADLRAAFSDSLARSSSTRRTTRPARSSRERSSARQRAVPDPRRARADRRHRRDPGIATVPGTSFDPGPAQGRGQIRSSFPKRLETLHAAAERIAALSS